MLQEPSFWIFLACCGFLWQYQRACRLRYLLDGRMASRHSILNLLQNSISLNGVEERDAYLRAAASLLRYAYERQTHLQVSMTEELEQCRRLIVTHNIARGTAVDLSVQGPEALLRQGVAPFSLIAIVENALRHGSIDPFGTIRIDLAPGPERSFTVSFSGYVLPTPSDLSVPRRGDGLRLLQSRLRDLHSGAGSWLRPDACVRTGDRLHLIFPV